MIVYCRNGGITMAETDGIAACHNYPGEYSLRPWTRPDGRPDVLIPYDWQQLGLLARIDLARSTYPDNGAGIEIDAAKADEVIADYLARTTPPEKDKP
jgi:hypothetical protein